MVLIMCLHLFLYHILGGHTVDDDKYSSDVVGAIKLFEDETSTVAGATILHITCRVYNKQDHLSFGL